MDATGVVAGLRQAAAGQQVCDFLAEHGHGCSGARGGSMRTLLD